MDGDMVKLDIVAAWWQGLRDVLLLLLPQVTFTTDSKSRY
jgi:hypothetical protein